MTIICRKLWVWLVGKLLRITRAKRYAPIIPRTLPMAAPIRRPRFSRRSFQPCFQAKRTDKKAGNRDDQNKENANYYQIHLLPPRENRKPTKSGCPAPASVFRNQ